MQSTPAWLLLPVPLAKGGKFGWDVAQGSSSWAQGGGFALSRSSDSPSSEIWVKHTSLLSCTSKIISSKDKEINYGDNAD